MEAEKTTVICFARKAYTSDMEPFTIKGQTARPRDYVKIHRVIMGTSTSHFKVLITIKFLCHFPTFNASQPHLGPMGGYEYGLLAIGHDVQPDGDTLVKSAKRVLFRSHFSGASAVSHWISGSCVTARSVVGNVGL